MAEPVGTGGAPQGLPPPTAIGAAPSGVGPSCSAPAARRDPPLLAAPPSATPPATSDDGLTAPAMGNMNHVLETNYLGNHKLRVKQIQNREYTRQLSKVGVKAVKESIEARGWISANAPYVLVPRESLPDGKETVWSSEVLSSLQVFCLDGNHRLRALSMLYGDEYELEVRLYLHFDDDIMVNALARSVNNTTEATAVTTTYDRLFSCKKPMEAVMVKYKLGKDASKVTAKMLSDAYKMSGDVPPSTPTLCSYKRLVIGLKAPAFAALKAASESEEKGVGILSLSKSLLDGDAVLKFPPGREHEQSLLIHILARFKTNDPAHKMPIKTDLPKLKHRALDAGEYYRLVTSVIPYESWSSAFHKTFYSLVYGKHMDWETWGKGHMTERDEQVEHRAGLLKKNHDLSEEHVRIIKSQLPSKLAQVAKRSPDMQPFLDTWEKKMAEVNVFVEQHKASADSSSSSSSSESSDDDESTPELRNCGVCKPSPGEGWEFRGSSG